MLRTGTLKTKSMSILIRSIFESSWIVSNITGSTTSSPYIMMSLIKIKIGFCQVYNVSFDSLSFLLRTENASVPPLYRYFYTAPKYFITLLFPSLQLGCVVIGFKYYLFVTVFVNFLCTIIIQSSYF